MNKVIFRSILLAAGIMVCQSDIQAQQPKSGSAYTGVVLPVKNGSVNANVRGKGISKSDASRNLAAILGLSGNHTFSQISENTDKLGITHTGFQQYYLGVAVDGGNVLVHSKDGLINSINGKLAQLGTLNVHPAISGKDAIAFAVKSLDVKKTLKSYPAQLVIASTSTASAAKEYVLVYKCRVDGRTGDGSVVMMNVFIDAATGRVLKNTSLIAHTDVIGTAYTIYSGTRTIRTDSVAAGYRLRDNVRKVETYDVAGKDMIDDGVTFYDSPRDYFSASTDWNVQPAFMKMSLTTVTNNMLTGLGFQSGKFVTSLMLKGNNVNNEMVAWPDIKISPNTTATLPITSHNIYVFPLDTNYIGGFGKADVFSGSFDVTDSAFFHTGDISVGTHPWLDIHGNAGTYTVSKEKNPALDAHWGMEMTHDFYNEVFSRNSYDGNGSVVKNFINGMWPMSFTQSNAAALPAPYFSMVYGMGDGENTNPFVALDVMGHEFTHMVTESNGHGGLDYQGESGALNESFSDIFGTCIEFYAKPTEANWNIGEGLIIGGGALRSMASPKVGQNPDTYEGTYWADPSDLQNDNGGVHTNSGVQNKWFYLLTMGGSGTNDKGDAYTVTGIGIAKAEKITYRNLTNYLTPQADYMEAYEGSLQATLDLYANDTTSQEYRSVKQAWFAVGIGNAPPVTSVNEIAVKDNDLKLYPNPATGKVTISSALDQKLEGQILNVVGVPVMNITVTKGLNPLDISGLAKGMYMIRYNTGAKGYVQKLSVL